MASGRLIDYLGSGLAAARPAAPSLHAGTLGIYFATDTQALSLWDGVAWRALIGVKDSVTALAISAGVVNIDLSLGDYFTLALSANVTSITFSSLPGAGKGASKMIRITQDATPRTVAWPASFKWPGGSAGSVSAAGGSVDLLAITTLDNGVAWNATLSKAFA